jgi:hypothetical protein
MPRLLGEEAGVGEGPGRRSTARNSPSTMSSSRSRTVLILGAPHAPDVTAHGRGIELGCRKGAPAALSERDHGPSPTCSRSARGSRNSRQIVAAGTITLASSRRSRWLIHVPSRTIEFSTSAPSAQTPLSYRRIGPTHASTRRVRGPMTTGPRMVERSSVADGSTCTTPWRSVPGRSISAESATRSDTTGTVEVERRIGRAPIAQQSPAGGSGRRAPSCAPGESRHRRHCLGWAGARVPPWSAGPSRARSARRPGLPARV